MQAQITVNQRAQAALQGGLFVRTGLRGGVCVDVDDQVKAALQTLTAALGGTATATVPTSTADPSTTSS